MSLTVRTPVPPEDDLDGLLRAFFKAQLPHPWPAPRAPRAPVAPAPSRLPLLRSRLVLAASVALLLLGALSFPARVPTGPELPGRLQDVEANAKSNPLWPPRNRMFLEQPRDAPTVIKFEWYEPAPAK